LTWEAYLLDVLNPTKYREPKTDARGKTTLTITYLSPEERAFAYEVLRKTGEPSVTKAFLAFMREADARQRGGEP